MRSSLTSAVASLTMATLASTLSLSLPLATSLACGSLRINGDSVAADSHAEQLDVADAVTEVSVEVGSGSVELVGAGVSTVSVRSKIDGPKNHLRQELTGGKLRVFIDCAEEPCRASVNATLPSSVSLRAKTGSGDISLRGQSGSTSLETGSGDISASELTGASVSAHTGSGDIELGLTKATERLQARAGSGNVKIRVPRGSYRLDLKAGSGSRSVRGIVVEDSAPNWITVQTGSGDVQIDAP